MAMQLRRFLAALSLLALGSMLMFELDPSLKYEMRAGQYRWMGQKIFDPKTEIDILFMGSSRTWTAVDTIELNRRFPDQIAYNFGKNWHGRQVDYVVLEDLLREKKVKKIALEVYRLEPGDIHPYTKFLAHPWDLSAQDFVNLSLEDVLLLSPRFKFALEIQLQILLGLPVKSYYLLARRALVGSFREEDLRQTDLSYGHLQPPVTEEDQARFWSEIRDVPEKYDQDDDSDEVILDRYLHHIGELAQRHGVELYFLFVPARNEDAPGPRYRELLDRYGTFVDLRERDLNRFDLWRDSAHLNRKGAELFTERVAASVIYSRK
jgi:hypothetical protein